MYDVLLYYKRERKIVSLLIDRLIKFITEFIITRRKKYERFLKSFHHTAGKHLSNLNLQSHGIE